ncbi:hypothetical protein RWZ02_12475 [Clostridium butyricum]|jgi:hypothetical protein|nr:hypothetical protein [Clostridium butyricum]
MSNFLDKYIKTQITLIISLISGERKSKVFSLNISAITTHINIDTREVIASSVRILRQVNIVILLFPIRDNILSEL